jgi:hypothetical protein
MVFSRQTERDKETRVSIEEIKSVVQIFVERWLKQRLVAGSCSKVGCSEAIPNDGIKANRGSCGRRAGSSLMHVALRDC